MIWVLRVSRVRMFGVWGFEFVVWGLETGVWYSVFEACCLGCGVSEMAFGVAVVVSIS